MIARIRIAATNPEPSVRTVRETGRPARPFDRRRSCRRTPARKTRDRVRVVAPVQSSVASQVGSVTDWDASSFAFVLDPDFDQEDDDLALGPAWRLAHAVRAEEDDAFGY